MSTSTPTTVTAPVREPKLSRADKRAIAAKGKLSSPWASFAAVVIAVLWTIPTFGLLVTSIRPEARSSTAECSVALSDALACVSSGPSSSSAGASLGPR